jgi:hypothetical protein
VQVSTRRFRLRLVAANRAHLIAGELHCGTCHLAKSFKGRLLGKDLDFRPDRQHESEQTGKRERKFQRKTKEDKSGTGGNQLFNAPYRRLTRRCHWVRQGMWPARACTWRYKKSRIENFDRDGAVSHGAEVMGGRSGSTGIRLRYSSSIDRLVQGILTLERNVT